MGDIATVVGGSTPKSKVSAYWGGEIPWIGVADLTDYVDKYISGGARTITEEGHRSCATQMLPKGTVLFSSRAPIGYVAIAGQPLCTSQGFKSFVLGDSMSPEYVYWYLHYARPLAEARAGGTTFKELSGRAAAALPIPVPPRAEQDRIVETVEQQMALIGDALGRVEAASKLLGVLREALRQEACLGRLVRSGDAHREDGPDYDAGDGQAPFPKLPSGWSWTKLEELAAPEPRSFTDGPFGSNLKTAHYTRRGPRVIRLQNIGDEEFFDAEAHISRERFQQLQAHEAKPGDIVIAALGETLPRACLVPRWLGPAIVKADCPRLRLKAGLNPAYVVTALNSRPVRAQAARIIHGVGRPRLNMKEMRALLIPTPPREMQDAIVDALSKQLEAGRRLGEDIAAARTTADALMRSLLHHAFTGQLVPQDPNDEPASDLLERIRAEKAEREAAIKAKQRAVRSEKRRPLPSPGYT